MAVSEDAFFNTRFRNSENPRFYEPVLIHSYSKSLRYCPKSQRKQTDARTQNF
jgi:hypothetical protein